MNTLTQEIINFVLDNDGEVTIRKDPAYGSMYDLNSEMKSHLHLFDRGNETWVAMRYNEEFKLEEVSDIVYHARHAMHGRDYASNFWHKILANNS